MYLLTVFSTAVNQGAEIDAHNSLVQEFFVKQTAIGGAQKIILKIMEFWKKCAVQNNFLK